MILEAAGDCEVEFHTHCTTGLGSLCVLEAVKAGVRIINTAIPPLSDASSNPSIFNVCKNLRALGFQTRINEGALEPVTPHFLSIADQNGFPIGRAADYDEAQYIHQVPGGMISDMRFQLERVGKGHQLQQAMEETAQVRAELGYPIMVTPLSQFVGTQASINLMVGGRYSQVTDQVIEYPMGRWGEDATEVMDQNIRDRILDRPRAREIAAEAVTDLTGTCKWTELDGRRLPSCCEIVFMPCRGTAALPVNNILRMVSNIRALVLREGSSWIPPTSGRKKR